MVEKYSIYKSIKEVLENTRPYSISSLTYEHFEETLNNAVINQYSSIIPPKAGISPYTVIQWVELESKLNRPKTALFISQSYNIVGGLKDIEELEEKIKEWEHQAKLEKRRLKYEKGKMD